MKSAYIIIITVIFIFFNLLILIFPELTIKSTSRGLIIWYNSALPSLLPFIISINLLKRTSAPIIISKFLEPVSRKLFKISGIGVFPILMGMLSGYPLGAKLCCELYNEGKISRSLAQRILCFCNNSGPLFIIGTVGTMFFKNPKLGYFLMAVHYLSAIIIGMVLSVGKNEEKSYNKISNKTEPIGKILSDSLSNSIETIVMIGGYIILFSIITGYIQPLIKGSCLKSIVCGFFEITLGISLAPHNFTGIFISSALISWGGLSIHFQSLGFISKTDLSIFKYLLAKLMQGILTASIVFLSKSTFVFLQG